MQPDFATNATWKARFYAPQIGLPQIAARNPQRGMAVGNGSGTFQLYAWQINSQETRQITNIPGGTTFGGISPDGNYIYYLDETQTGHFMRIPFEGGQAEDITPTLPPYSSNFIAQSLNGYKIGFTTITQQGFQCWLLTMGQDNKPVQPQLIHQSEGFALGPLLNFDGSLGVIATMHYNADNALSLMAMAFQPADLSHGQNVKVLEEPEGMLFPIAFAPLPGDSRFLGTTSASGQQRPVIWDVKNGDRIDLPLADIEGDIQAWGWSDDGERLLLKRTFQAVDQLYIYDLERSTLDSLAHPPGVYASGFFLPNSKELIVDIQESIHPNYVISLSAKTGQITRHLLDGLFHIAPSIRLKSIQFEAMRGLTLQGWLGLPEGDKPFPAVIYLHDGPGEVLQGRYLPEAQAWLDHGVAFLGINYRGSSTFGDEFEGAIYGFPGHREVDDTAAACHWLIEQGIAQPEAVFVDGMGYGGYLVLQALGRRPDLWAGGMAESAVMDWRMHYEDSDESQREMQSALFRGTPDEVPEQTRSASPITYVDTVEAPLLLFTHHDDSRIPYRQVEHYVSALQQHGGFVQQIEVNSRETAIQPEDQVKKMEAKLRFVAERLQRR